MFQIEKFHYNMKCRTKDHLILENTYNQCDSDHYISYEFKIDKCHIVLHYTWENHIRIWRKTINPSPQKNRDIGRRSTIKNPIKES